MHRDIGTGDTHSTDTICLPIVKTYLKNLCLFVASVLNKVSWHSLSPIPGSEPCLVSIIMSLPVKFYFLELSDDIYFFITKLRGLVNLTI